MIVSKDIHSSHPPSGTHTGPPSILTRSGTLKAESSVGSEDELGRLPGREKETQKSDFTAKADNADNIFIEDVSAQDGQWKPIHIYCASRLRFLDYFSHQLPFRRNFG
jgi:hypothetical protein